MNDSEPPMMVQMVERKRFPWGCLLGGCLSIIVLTLVAVIGVSVATYSFYTAQLKKYTAESPAPIPQIEYSPDELAEIEERVKTFQETIEKGATPGEIVLTADEINALISQNKDLKGRVFVTIGEGQVSADVSMPTDAIPGAKGRYFNASVTLNVSLENGVLIVTVAEAETNGEPVPKEIMNALSKENLAKDIYRDPKIAAVLRKFDRLIIEDNRIILKPVENKSEPTNSKTGDSTQSTNVN